MSSALTLTCTNYDDICIMTRILEISSVLKSSKPGHFVCQGNKGIFIIVYTCIFRYIVCLNNFMNPILTVPKSSLDMKIKYQNTYFESNINM